MWCRGGGDKAAAVGVLSEGINTCGASAAGWQDKNPYVQSNIAYSGIRGTVHCAAVQCATACQVKCVLLAFDYFAFPAFLPLDEKLPIA